MVIRSMMLVVSVRAMAMAASHGKCGCACKCAGVPGRWRTRFLRDEPFPSARTPPRRL